MAPKIARKLRQKMAENSRKWQKMSKILVENVKNTSKIS